MRFFFFFKEMAHMCKNYLNVAIEIKCTYVANYIIIINCLKLLK